MPVITNDTNDNVNACATAELGTGTTGTVMNNIHMLYLEPIAMSN